MYCSALRVVNVCYFGLKTEDFLSFKSDDKAGRQDVRFWRLNVLTTPPSGVLIRICHEGKWFGRSVYLRMSFSFIIFLISATTSPITISLTASVNGLLILD